MSVIPTKGNPHATITPDQVKVNGAKRPSVFTDEAALRLTVQDASNFEAWLDNKQYLTLWRESDVLYQSPRNPRPWENGVTTEPDVSRFTVAKHVNSLVPTFMSGLFYDTPPFILRPRPGTTQETTRAWTSLFSVLLDRCEFKQESEEGIESGTLNGTAIFKGGWVKETKIRKKFVRKNAPAKATLPFESQPRSVHTAESDEFEVKEVVEEINKPLFEFCQLGTVLVDPAWNKPNQIHKAKALVHRRYMTYYQMEKLRENPSYNLPDADTLKGYWAPPIETAVAPSAVEKSLSTNTVVMHAEGQDQETTEDPYAKPLKVDERWDADHATTVLQDKLLIRNEAHNMSRICFFSFNWWNIQNSGWGLGVGRLVGADQRLETGMTNAALKILALAVNQQYIRSRGANVPTQQIRSRLGGIIDVDGDVDKAFKILESPKVPVEAFTILQNSRQQSESTSGADETMVQGNLPQKGGSSIGRTATGAGNLAAASASRLQGPLGRFVDNVFIPFLQFVDEMVRENMPISEIRQILGDELGDDFMKQLDIENFMNAQMRYEVLAGAHLAAKKAMAQALPWLVQVFENPHILDSLNKTGWTVDVKELYGMMMEMSEWKNSRQLIRELNPQEKKMYAQATQGQIMQKSQLELQKIDAKHQAKAQEIDQSAEARLASKITEDSLDRAGGFVERQVAEHAMQEQALGGKDAQYTTA